MPRPRHSSDDRNRGFTSVFVALILTALMIVAAIAIDGSFSYSQRRAMQNAADLGAMAGGQAVYKAQTVVNDGTYTVSTLPLDTYSSGVPTCPSSSQYDVYAQVYCTSVVKDGASIPTDGEDFCNVITSTGTSLGKCYDSTLTHPESNVLNSTAAGVQVVTENSRTTFFGQFAGRSTVVVHAKAAASMQQLGGVSAAWIVCGTTAQGGYNLLNDTGGGDETTSDTGADTDDKLFPMSTLLPIFGYNGNNASNRPGSPAQATIIFQGSKAPSDCGTSSDSAKGRGNGSVLGNGMLEVTPGNGNTVTNNNTSVPVGNCWGSTVGSPDQACVPCPNTIDINQNFTPCDLLLPVVDWGTGNGSGANFHVVTEAVFHVEKGGNGNEKVVGWLDDPSGFRVTTTFTQTGGCAPPAVCVVKLIDFPSSWLE